MCAWIPCAQSAETATKKSLPPLEQGVIVVTGLPSVIESRVPYLGDAPPQCIDFSVSVIGKSAPELHITTVAVANARLRELPSNSTEACNITGKSAPRSIFLHDVNATERRVRLFIPSESFPRRAQGEAAKLLLVKLDSPPSEQALLLLRQNPEWQNLIVWLAGVVAPLIAAALSYVIKTAYDRRKAHNESAEAFRRQHATDLADFFGNLYKSTVELETPDEYAKTLERELEAKGILGTLDAGQLDRLRAAVRANDRRLVGNILIHKFPENSEAIRRAHPGDRLR
jgi:hypothetical protein